MLIPVHHAVSLVREVMDRVGRGELPGMPSASVLRFSADGLTIEGPVEAGGRAVPLSALLLDTLLSDVERPAELRVPGALRIVIARASGILDLPPYSSLESFAAALERFSGTGDADEIARALAVAWVAAGAPQAIDPAPPPAADEVCALVPYRPATALAIFPAGTTELTISDIRRARRATGLTLGDVSASSSLPVERLRELEWGDLRNWPGGLNGRELVLRYARAAGLDEQVVAMAVWPLLLEARETADPPIGLKPPVDPAEPPVELQPAADDRGHEDRRRWSRGVRAMARAAAVVTLVSAGTTALIWRTSPRPPMGGAGVPAAANAPPVEPAAAKEPAVSKPAVAVPTARPRRDAGRPAAPNGGSRAAAQPAKSFSDGGTAYSPTFASAGSAVFYHAQSSGISRLMRADTDARGEVLQITSVVADRGHNFHARPSPDGKRIAFDSDRDGERGVYVADVDGRNARRVTGSGFAAIPSWSPDGRMLAVVRAEPGRPRVWNLWTVELATSRMRRLTSYPYGQPWGGSWFPDGHRIAYSHEDRLYVLDLRNRTSREYPTPVKGRLVRTPAVSPNGKRIIFQVYRDGAWMLNLNDGSMQKVLWDPYAEEYAWSPDGRRVAFHSRRSGGWGIWVMGAD